MQIGTGITNALIDTRKGLDKDFASEAEEVPIISTSAAYGVYMAVSSNLRYVYLLHGLLMKYTTYKLSLKSMNYTPYMPPMTSSYFCFDGSKHLCH